MTVTSQPVRRADVLALTAAMLFPSLLTWVYFLVLNDRPSAIQQTVYGLGKALQFGFPLVWVLAVRRESLQWPASCRAGMAEGAAFGLLIFAAIVGAYFFWLAPAGWLAGAAIPIYQRVSHFGVAGPLAFAAMGLFYCVLHSLLEEYYWRWFVFGRLRQFLPLPTAILLASAGFAAHHAIVLGTYFGPLSPLTGLFTLAVGVGGAVWCHIYQRSGSLFGPWLSHALVDGGIFVVGYALVRGVASW